MTPPKPRKQFLIRVTKADIKAWQSFRKSILASVSPGCPLKRGLLRLLGVGHKVYVGHNSFHVERDNLTFKTCYTGRLSDRAKQFVQQIDAMKDVKPGRFLLLAKRLD